MTIKKLHEDAIKYDEPLVAHYIFFLLQEGKVRLDDGRESLPYDYVNDKDFRKIWKENHLGFDQTKIYSLKIEGRLFAFVFAESEEEAIKCFRYEFGKKPMNCHELLMDWELFIGNRYINFRDWKLEFEHFPTLVCVYEKEVLTPTK